MYGKIFESIFDSTLAAEGGWMPTYIFMSMVVLADKNGVVDVAPKALYRRLGFSDYDSKIAYEDFIAAIEYLQDEDQSSRSSKEAGRRIVPLSEIETMEGNRGFVIVNYSYYRDKGKREDRASSSTERVRKFREKNKKNNDETQSNKMERGNAHTDTDTDTDTDEEINQAAWSDYVQHRKEKKKPITPLSETKQKNVLRKHSYAEQQKMVDKAIASGWTGLYPLDKKTAEISRCREL